MQLRKPSCSHIPSSELLTCLMSCIALCTLGANPALGYPEASFQGLGSLPGGQATSLATGVSADGSTVVGYSTSDGGSPNEAFRWTEATGMVGLGDIPGGGTYSEGEAVSANGLVLVGRGWGPVSDAEAFRWTQTDGMVSLGFLPGASTSESYAVSADGSVIAGGHSQSPNGPEAWRWTEESGVVGLGDLPGGEFVSYASGISADGSVIVGGGTSASASEAFRWTEATGMVGLGYLSGGSVRGYATAVSEDGTVVVGSDFSTLAGEVYLRSEAFRWTEASGMVGLGDLPGGRLSSIARGLSANGHVIVGESNSDSGGEAMIWDATKGMRSLRDLLTEGFGLDLSGWTLKSATGVSLDGRTIVGWGYNPDGNWEAWRAELSCLPCQQHGDVFPPGEVPGNCTVDLDDILFELAAFADTDPCVNFPGSNLFPCGASCDPGDQGVVDLDDLLASLAAFAGDFSCPHPCGS